MRRLALIALVVLAASSGSAAPGSASTGWRIVRGWPCAGCILEVPAAAHHAPVPLLVALHGDEGDPALTAGVWGPVAAAHGMALLAPQCPTALGCRFQTPTGATNSWWGWLQSGKYVDGWLGRQTDLVAKRYHVDARREYLAGWSGGADFLGLYALRHADQFAAAAFVAGGVPYVQTCPARRIAAFFVWGTADPRYLSGQPGSVHDLLQRCGSETRVVAVPGADHQASIATLQSGTAATIAAWFLRHRLASAPRR